MRLGTYTTTDDSAPWTGVRTDDDTIVSLPEAGQASGLGLPDSMTDLLASYAWREKADLAVAYAEETGVGIYDAGDVSRHAPVTNPRKVVCVGLNYRDHAEEGDNEIPDTPVLFSKFPTTVAGPEDTIEWDPSLTEKVDYEAELVAVVGEQARRVEESEAMDHVAGFMVGNDVSARDLQHGDGQWVRGKSLDGFAPTGPELVSIDEVEDPHDLDIYAEVNGERLQDSSTEHLIFDIGELVSFCSQAFTLEPGDLIFTGTPPGVGVYRDPPVLLEEGDEVTIGVEELGEITNDCAFD
ncbi:fumarylacetoacetate hydrolase family protein [Halorussus halophilus]|uniref:fumarylacetoacetate hydrolase family protein n=1 Tax=Halorussus halophilus TaxID=2650975 RepID=UPI0013015747|nr:fumarylacetoacetate hydrolase family protein [Halorussus halophilus]